MHLFGVDIITSKTLFNTIVHLPIACVHLPTTIFHLPRACPLTESIFLALKYIFCGREVHIGNQHSGKPL
jgi:hypothetical protein